MTSPEAIVSAASQLPTDQRAAVAVAIFETLEPLQPDDPAFVRKEWQKEVQRRSEELRDGTVEPIPWEHVQRDAEQLFNDKNS